MKTKSIIYLISAAVVGVVLLIASLIMLKFATVKGNEMGVMETWLGGVEERPYYPGTHFLFPGWTKTMYTYDVSSQVFIMRDGQQSDPKDKKLKPILGSFHVQSSEGQDMAISLNVRWHTDPDKIVELHKGVRGNFEEKLIAPVVMRIVKDEATLRKAIDAYSGEGLVKLQKDIQNDLMNPNGELAKRGIVVENFVIEGIRLDETYIGEIRARQVATQKKLRSDEETKAADAEALTEKAKAQADLNRRVVAAERDKQVGILKAQQEAKMAVLGAEAEAEKVNLWAKAEQNKVIFAAEARQKSGLMEADAILAIGKAKAEATKLELSAYSVTGSDNYTKIKVSESMANAHQNIKGYLPQNMNITVLSENFMRSLDNFLSPREGKK